MVLAGTVAIHGACLEGELGLSQVEALRVEVEGISDSALSLTGTCVTKVGVSLAHLARSQQFSWAPVFGFHSKLCWLCMNRPVPALGYLSALRCSRRLCCAVQVGEVCRHSNEAASGHKDPGWLVASGVIGSALEVVLHTQTARPSRRGGGGSFLIVGVWCYPREG